jgi:hypothetical protein
MSAIWHMTIGTLLSTATILLLVYLIAQTRIRSTRSGAQIEDGDQLTLAPSHKNVQLNIAVFVVLAFLACFVIVFVTVEVTEFALLGPFLFPFLAFVAIVAWIQSLILQIGSRSNSAWYNGFWPNFLLDCGTSLPVVIYMVWLWVYVLRHH